jgi:hypothetical protein
MPPPGGGWGGARKNYYVPYSARRCPRLARLLAFWSDETLVGVELSLLVLPGYQCGYG